MNQFIEVQEQAKIKSKKPSELSLCFERGVEGRVWKRTFWGNRNIPYCERNVCDPGIFNSLKSVAKICDVNLCKFELKGKKSNI